jgi:hypothetical protein
MLETNKNNEETTSDSEFFGALHKIRQRRKEIRDPDFKFQQPIMGNVNVTVISKQIDTVLRDLKSNEPTSDNEFFRMNIIMYELGDLSRALVYAERFRNTDKVMFRDGFKDKNTILAEGKLAMADLLTQLHMLCISMDWDIENLREMGAQHLAERQQDFKRDGWSEVK